MSSPARRMVLVSAVAAAVATVLSAGGPPAIAVALAAGTPSPTTSFYVYGSSIDVCGPAATTECSLYNDAASEAVPSSGGMTILDFGAPCFEPATLAWGTQLFNSQSCTPDNVLVTLAQAWLRGYETNPQRSKAPNYILVVGTSNSLTAADPGNALSPDQMAKHGQAFFTSVISPLVTVAQGLPSPVTIWAGDDIEESRDGNWYDGATTSAWVDAYSAASGASKPCVATRNGLVADYGDYVPNQPGWSVAAIYHVAYQAASACPVPEIYFDANAGAWQSVNRFAASAGLPQMQFAGVLSEDGANDSLTSSGSWESIRNATGQSVPYLSVIGLTGPITPEVPDAPSRVTVAPGPAFVTVGWSAPAWDGGSAVRSYTVFVYAGSTLAEQVTFSGFPPPEAVMVPGLANGKSYTLYVSASNKVGSGPRSLPSDDLALSGLFRLR